MSACLSRPLSMSLFFIFEYMFSHNRAHTHGGEILQDGVVGFEYNGIRAPPPPPPSAVYGSHYAYNTYNTKVNYKYK